LSKKADAISDLISLGTKQLELPIVSEEVQVDVLHRTYIPSVESFIHQTSWVAVDLINASDSTVAVH
jgi:hypothetical protein